MKTYGIYRKTAAREKCARAANSVFRKNTDGIAAHLRTAYALYIVYTDKDTVI